MTVWKLHNFSVTQILREFNFRDFRSAKSAVSTHLEAFKLDFYELLHFLKTGIYLNKKSKAPKIAKMALFVLSDPPKLVSRKIRVAEKS